MADKQNTIDSIIDDDEPQGTKILGRDISKIPCFKTSFFNGIAGGIVVGLASFMSTSNTRKATNRGFGAYFGITLVSWIVCRYRYSTKAFQEAQFKKALEQKLLTEGTELDKAMAESKSV